MSLGPQAAPQFENLSAPVFVLMERSDERDGDLVKGVTLDPDVAAAWEASMPSEGRTYNYDSQRYTKRFRPATSMEDVEEAERDQLAFEEAEAIKDDIMSREPEVREALEELGVDVGSLQ